jgi:hypothetical protein
MMKLKNNIIKKETRKKDLNQSELTFQILDPGYETKIISYKINQNKLWNSISNQPNFKGWNLKNKIKKTQKTMQVNPG